MKLFRVEASWYAVAEDWAEAQDIQPDLRVCDISAFETHYVDLAWRDEIPFGGKGDKTCGQILEEAGLD